MLEIFLERHGGPSHVAQPAQEQIASALRCRLCARSKARAKAETSEFTATASAVSVTSAVVVPLRSRAISSYSCRVGLEGSTDLSFVHDWSSTVFMARGFLQGFWDTSELEQSLLTYNILDG